MPPIDPDLTQPSYPVSPVAAEPSIGDAATCADDPLSVPVNGRSPACRQPTPPEHDLPSVPGYAVSAEIARGGMGVVYAAHDLTFEREVAIKVMHFGQNAGRFMVESKVTAQLPHPGVPPVHTLGTLADGRPFLAMKLIRGRTLGDELKAGGRGDLGRLLGVFERICETVGFAHSRGIMHRDLKPSNVMVGDFGEVLVMDWGLAKQVGSKAEDDHEHGPPGIHDGGLTATVAGSVKGTPAYMAPEQARGEAVDVRADVFALGGILAVLLTGQPPFVSDTVVSTVLKAASADLRDCFQLLGVSTADGELVTLAQACLAATAGNRPENGSAVATAVAGYRAGVEERLRRAEWDRAAAEAKEAEERNTRREAEAKAAEQRKRRRAQWALGGALLLLAVAGGVGTALASLWRAAESNRGEAVSQRDVADVAKAEAVAQRQTADHAKAEAVAQREVADQARAQADRAREKTEVF